MNHTILRCECEYEIDHQLARCVLSAGHEPERPCQVNLWLAVKVPGLEVQIGTSIEGAELTVRRVK